MRTRAKVGIGVVAAGALGVAGYAFLVPKTGHASRAEIEAVLPRSLKVGDVADPGAERRFVAVVALARGLAPKGTGRGSPFSGPPPPASTPGAEAVLGRIEAVLARGPIRTPYPAGSGGFSDLTALKDAAKACAYALDASRRRGDRAASLRWATLGLRFAHSVQGAGGAVIDALVALAIGAIVERATYVAEVEGAFDDAGRGRLLGLLPPSDGRFPAMAAAVRRDFRGYVLPALLDPKGHMGEIVGARDTADIDEEPTPEPPLSGTFDPVETARTAGRVYDALVSDLEAPYWRAKHGERRLLASLAVGLPVPPTTPTGERVTEGLEAIRYRLAMNAGRNTLGRMLAGNSVLTQLGDASAREGANRNLLRSVLLVRMGRRASELDPFSGRPLRIDPARRIVWSVGKDGRDDGGRIGRGGEAQSPDLGYPYGDHSFKPPGVARASAPLRTPGAPALGTRP